MPLRSGRPYLRWDANFWIAFKDHIYNRLKEHVPVNKADVLNSSSMLPGCGRYPQVYHDKSDEIQHAWKYLAQYLYDCVRCKDAYHPILSGVDDPDATVTCARRRELEAEFEKLECERQTDLKGEGKDFEATPIYDFA